MPKQGDRDGHHAALPYAEVPAFVARLRASEKGELARLAFEFLILTAARTGEVIGAKWDEVDSKLNLWTVPAHRMKAKRVHRVPLSDRCIAVLARAQRAVAQQRSSVFGTVLVAPDVKHDFLDGASAYKRRRDGPRVPVFISGLGSRDDELPSRAC